MKFVRPLYRALFESRVGKSIAVKTFLANEEFYHPIAAKMIARDLKVSDAANAKETITESQQGEELGSNDCELWLVYVVVGLIAISALGLAMLRRKR